MKSVLDSRQVAEFERLGFLPVHDLLDPVEDLAPITAEYSTVLDRLARDLFERDEIASLYSDLGFSERFMTIVAETGSAHSQYFDLSLPQSGISASTPIWNGPAVFSLLTNPTLLDAIESLIGDEIYSNPVQHVRIKPPEALVSRELAADQHALNATSWHQDNGVITPDADDSEILTVWIPLSRASVQHGCLQVIPGSHRSDVMLHCPGGPAGLEIPEKVLSRDGAIAVPLEPGDALFLHRRTAHASLPNTSDEIRWSLDLRYNPIGQSTGRAAFPGFVARSRRDPRRALSDPTAWARSWEETRDRLAVDRPDAFNRWDGDAPACA
ncbi:MAG: phytanoyl-CoA dioxygenase family protein [Acidimicrobiia bacterium]|nr:phytanoyl-CoA dioxygenase family protein [Acidimicrobiia bacterium]